MFRFKLEALLNHRRHQEEICQKQLSQAERHLMDEQGKLRQQKIKKRRHVRQLQAKQSADINTADIILSVNYIQQLTQTIESQKICVRDAAKQVNRKRNELIDVVKKRRILEKLKEKQWLAYRHEIMLDERKHMDEVASLRRARKTLK